MFGFNTSKCSAKLFEHKKNCVFVLKTLFYIITGYAQNEKKLFLMDRLQVYLQFLIVRVKIYIYIFNILV